MTPPRVSGKIIGFRAWKLADGVLRPAGYAEGDPWHAGVNEASCRIGHAAPASGCMCGLYAYHDWWSLTSVDSGAYGAVEAWGCCEVHARGFRAQFAQIVTLAFHPSQSARQVTAVRSVGASLGVPVVSVSDLSAVALEFGDPLEGYRP